MEDALVIDIQLAGGRYRVRTLRGSEATSSTLPVTASFFIPIEDGLDPDAVTGSPATVTLQRRGVVRRFTRVVAESARAAARRVDRSGSLVEVTLTPLFDTLRYRTDLRVFRDKDVPTIVGEVLGDMGVKVERRLSGSYGVRPYTVQWRESDHAFACRLLASEGIFYFVTDDDGVVLGDSPASFDDVQPIPFREASGLDGREDAVFEIGEGGAMAPGAFTFRDFDFMKPRLDMDGKAAGPSEGGPEVYVFPGKHGDPAGGARTAALAGDASAAASGGILGKAHAGWLRPGLATAIVDSPLEYVDRVTIQRVSFEYDETRQGFFLEFAALPEGVLPRPPRATNSPSINAPMIGYCVGPAGEDIHCDAWGRVKVHFPWDRLQPKDDNASDWVPTLQDNTGSSIGIPRIGWELLVHYNEGDPDRPVILGRLYNPLDDFYAELPANRMYSALRSLTSPRSDDGPTGYNQILLDDRAGFERINMHAEKDRRVVVANDKTENTDYEEIREVLRDETISVGKDRTVTVHEKRLQRVLHNRTEKIGGSRTLKVDAGMTGSVKKDHSVTIGGSHKRRIEDSDSVQVKKVHSEKIGAVDLEASVSDNVVRGNWVSAWTVGAAAIEVAKNTVSRNTGKLQIDTFGMLLQKAKEAVQTRVAKARTVKVGGSMTVTAVESATLNAVESIEVQAKTITIDAKERLSLTVGQTSWVLQGEEHHQTATADVEVRATGLNHLAAAVSKQNE